MVAAAGRRGGPPVFSLAEAVAKARELAGSCVSAASFLSDRPVFPLYQGLSDADSAARLKQACLEQLPRRYDPSRQPAAQARLERELRIINDKGFAAYFLVVRDIVSLCPRTCGRGSGASPPAAGPGRERGAYVSGPLDWASQSYRRGGAAPPDRIGPHHRHFLH
ncbi:MAG: hypothetical protein A2087_00380 [Spirochaetes bacterium GWD1_61_31]|nr:MAG: hypothetical protein A2Y37_00345 [Spirochaetes bacterium GWB1_60_80]OHD28918.1 MAG: hypothetical protein A2004_10825 [Spirochaetes bacterium GWC1_61_12]OHD39106.1 MAG: hypothetical protein A2087_00380 [Spirochaetes bacterium GWD1_61_31]OHD43547.1 MAG: hypothetical protein A2Y35_04715 [Spirochaetes bacterium GWE1_60_18]OHD59014.1 MAG: hypothetical protein A2Y32_01910 [Spirochaetes bacterium GWF1_60_12]HAP44512.1 hypothetical protein [Spirochaetaceae bacterium]